MAEFGLAIGWGSSRAGKEAAAGKVFEEAVAYWNALQAAGEIESAEQVLLTQHGGDLVGFFLVRGDPEKLGRLSMAPEFQRLSWRTRQEEKCRPSRRVGVARRAARLNPPVVPC